MEKVYILTEGGKTVGMGHVSRCGALYSEIVRRGIDCELIINGDNSVSGVAGKFKTENWLESDLRYLNDELVLVDSYLAGYDILQKISSIARKVMFIDDYNRLDYPNGVVVNPSLFGGALDYKIAPGLSYLVGKDYVILREPFRRNFTKELRKNIEVITVIMGGTDMLGITPDIYDTVKEHFRSVHVNVILGKAAAELAEALRPKLDSISNVYIDASADEIIRLFSESDVVVSAAGQTCYELVQLRTPSILIKIAENQEGNIREMSRRGLAHTVKIDSIKIGIPVFLKHFDFRSRFNAIQKMQAYDFSKGVENIVSSLISGNANR